MAQRHPRTWTGSPTGPSKCPRHRRHMRAPPLAPLAPSTRAPQLPMPRQQPVTPHARQQPRMPRAPQAPALAAVLPQTPQQPNVAPQAPQQPKAPQPRAPGPLLHTLPLGAWAPEPLSNKTAAVSLRLNTSHHTGSPNKPHLRPPRKRNPFNQPRDPTHKHNRGMRARRRASSRRSARTAPLVHYFTLSPSAHGLLSRCPTNRRR